MATKSIAWNTGNGNITLTYQGHGDGDITISSDPNDLGSARSQVINIETTAGSPAVVKDFTVRQGACPVPVGTVLNYAYTGSYQEVELPAGQYKLQCWGAQGGSNAAASSYGITAKAGGKGGYSEGVLTLTSKTTVRIYVGGAGSSSAGGFNGGGSTSGSSSYSSGNEQGVSRMGGGGGATDIRLSDGALLSRMIVAGGGSGGAMAYRSVTTSITSWSSLPSSNYTQWNYASSSSPSGRYYVTEKSISSWSAGDYIRVSCTCSSASIIQLNTDNDGVKSMSNGSYYYYTIKSGTGVIRVQCFSSSGYISYDSISISAAKRVSSTVTNTYNYSEVGFVGGGATGGGYSDSHKGKQNAAGTNGSFGQGANQTTTNYRYCSGAGGGGWYGGGGGQYSDSDTTIVNQSGGGSGFVNTAANASYRPSGYTGLQLDSGATYAGNTSFESTSGGTETGHSGDGYAKITRIS